VHFINLTGHSQTGYFDPVPMSGIRVAVAGDFRSARAVRTGKVLALTRRDGASEFTPPALAMYQPVELRAARWPGPGPGHEPFPRLVPRCNGSKAWRHPVGPVHRAGDRRDSLRAG